jgi:hypothetical protein
MYGYGGDGKVVAPGENAYQITNESTYSVSEEVTLINPCYPVTKITAYHDFQPETGDEAKSKEEQYKTYITETLGLEYNDNLVSGQYGYYTVEKNNTIVKLATCQKHSDLASDCQKAETYEYYYRDDTDSLDGTAYNDVEKGPQEARETLGLPLNIASIQTEIKTWALKPATDAVTLKAGELAMTINSLDLSKVSTAKDSKLDITGLNWTVPAPGQLDENNEVVKGKEGKLSLPIQAQIAGGNVNEEGCVPIVKVTYTLTPNEEVVNSLPQIPPSDES